MVIMPHHQTVDADGESIMVTSRKMRDMTCRKTTETGLLTMPVIACTISRHIAHCEA
jgi:hypothetical protein